MHARGVDRPSVFPGADSGPAAFFRTGLTLRLPVKRKTASGASPVAGKGAGLG